MFRTIFKLVAVLAAMAASPAMAQVSADFTTGAIAEYDSNNANRNNNTKSFATLGISKIAMSQSGSSWGGTQGNDLSVTLTITFTDNSTYTIPSAVLNWQKNASGGGVDYFGVTTSAVVPDSDDRYARSSALLKKTYILVLPSKISSSGFSGLITSDGTDGSANFSPADVFAALQADFPAPVPPAANAAPTFTGQNAENGTSFSFNYAENSADGAIVGTVRATDPENAALTYSITGGNDSNWYAINATTGAITLTPAGAAALVNNFEQAPNTQTLTVSVSDGANVTVVQVALNETNVNDGGPAFTGTNSTDGNNAAAYSFDYAENAVVGATLGSVAATDPDGTAVTFSITAGNANGWFAINPATGAITLTAAGAASLANDFEATPNLQTLTVSASDGTTVTTIEVRLNETNVSDGGPAFTGTNATGANNAPAYSFDYAENAVVGATLGSVAATDPDGTAVTFSITAGNANGWFAINPATGAITLTTAGAASLANDFEATPNLQTLTVSASDGTTVTTIEVRLNETNVDDSPPAITGPSGSPDAAVDAISVNEGQTSVVRLVAAEPVAWSITSGNDRGQFQIAADGTITFVAAPDFERPTDTDTNNTYVLTVTATDAAGNISTQTITVTVLNVDDTAPAITGPGGTAGAPNDAISVNEGQTSVVRLVAAEPVTWSITSGNDRGQFQIAADGTITFVAAPDFEIPTDTDTNNTYVLTVTATDAAGNISTQTITVTVLNVDDTAPVITGPSGGAGAAASAISVNEGQAAVTRLEVSEPVTWSITSGNDRGKFQIAADGTITFVAAPDFEIPTDADTNNTYVLTVTATDAAGNVSTQTITVTVLNVDDTAPVITGPSGGAGAAASVISINEGQTAVTRLNGNEPVTWSITSGNDRGKFQIAADGSITFLVAPDFEIPTDTDTNNTYVLTVTATDAAGNVSTQTVTVTVLDIDDTAPTITGPSGGPGAAASALTITEGLTAVTRFTANEAVTWSIDSGTDAAKFRIDAATGTIVFVAAPDFENPADSDRNNTYVVRIKAVDAVGNVSFQTLTVTITNVDEIARKLAEIGGKLRGSLRNYAAHGLSDMLAFNESLMAGNDNFCASPKTQKGLSGSVNVNEKGGNLDVNYAQRLSDCSRPHQIFADAGLTTSRMGGNWNTRVFGALRFETKLNEDLTLGLAALVSRSSDELTGFDESSISDKSLQINAYGRYNVSDTLRTGAFIGLGKAWYDFALTESDGFDLDGSMTGKRQVFGWMLSGDFNLGDTVVTTDAVISHAREKIGSATLAARYLGENRSDIAFAVGTVDVTRISVPVTAPISLTGSADYGAWSRLLLSPGLLCEDNDVQSSSIRCGYQIGAKLIAYDGSRSRLYADYQWESVAGMRRAIIGAGMAYRFGKRNDLEVALEANRGARGLVGQDNRAMLSIRLAQ